MATSAAPTQGQVQTAFCCSQVGAQLANDCLSNRDHTKYRRGVALTSLLRSVLPRIPNCPTQLSSRSRQCSNDHVSLSLRQCVDRGEDLRDLARLFALEAPG